MQWLHCVSAYFRGWPIFLVFSNIFRLIFESAFSRRSANFRGNTVCYVRKVEDQINRSSFLQLDHNPTQELDFKVEKWLEKWTENKSTDDKWQSYLKPTNGSPPGKMYGLIKTHKVGNPARLITSGCSTAM